MAKKFTQKEARRVGKKLGVDFRKVSLKEFTMGMNVEQEHAAVLGDDPEILARVSLDHLKEHPNYYTMLQKLEKEE